MKSNLPSMVKDQLKTFLWDFPTTGNYLLRRYLQKHLKVEMDLIQGKHQSDNTLPSIIHFSANKAATQHVRDLLGRCAAENGMTTVGLAEYAFHTNFPYLDQLSCREMESYQYLFKPAGYLYTVFGGMVEGIQELERYRVILMLRDPRDVLVSEYYSYAFSHPEPSKFGSKYNNFMAMRRKAQNVLIDEYVENECDRIFATYQRYATLLLDRYPHVFFTKYEEMTSDFQGWLKKLLDYCGLEISDQLFDSLLNEAEHLRPKNEDIHQHVRKGIPGDYMVKLGSKTIAELNSKLLPVLERFNYLEG
ncbi:MAG: sulfotransferase domain-containing protein [Anaerolineales bacterium]